MSVLEVRSGTRLSHRLMEEIVHVDELMKAGSRMTAKHTAEMSLQEQRASLLARG